MTAHLVVSEGYSQLRLHHSIGHQQILDFLELLFAFLCVRVELSSHREVLKQFQSTHRGPCSGQ